MTVQLEGGKLLESALKKLPGRVAKKVVKGATLKGAAVVRKDAKRRVPVDSGKLKKAISAKKTAESPVSVTYSVGPTTKGFYGQFIEFGTEKKPARPFLRPAFDENQNEIVAKIEEGLKKGIDREAKKLKNGN